MSINLGNETMAAARALRFNEPFAALRLGLGQFAHKKMSTALDSAVDLRIEATAYARALRDVWVALESATLEIPQNGVERPQVPPLPDPHGRGGPGFPPAGSPPVPLTPGPLADPLPNPIPHPTPTRSPTRSPARSPARPLARPPTR